MNVAQVMHAQRQTPLAKRVFFQRMFHPHGAQASNMAGLIPTSPDVAEAEFHAATADRGIFPGDEVDHVIQRANEVHQMYMNLAEEYGPAIFDESDGDIRSMSLVEILVGFHVAMELEKMSEQQLVR